MFGPFTITQVVVVGIIVVAIGFVGLGVAYYSFMVTKNMKRVKIGVGVAIVCILVLPFGFTVASTFMPNAPIG
ncbi:hypothetical protein [Corynebacterium pyruviciproducens]|uniref:Uncharacterized protein n=2 Tax=Corynebacterium pyruviciproducens TaxID=598660 RepID=S2ZWV9_9CORY|nr:hypothetical protein [Corynebacterium pyruviciproducens]EPD68544.1 hypothetical protein HMPREF1219_01728 [Corynebacterium pyruviciproducens ATCC BAA-1742]MDH4658083.1 hypothetical protein [Corynebacterium pyruviciproducens]MDK6567116.1 hypothetical protein [Corynebacterium pyruviciproducens]MDK7215400.1 hypothetical protein [Corynebacterium pyruviciproducens]WOT02170.1 hypothetical protein CYJ47_13160 [Corynebacterium pyruviciproducens]